MNYADEPPLCRFGTALEPLEEDDVPKKKIAIEDQIVTDENGRRRFHGAFTGGFSAGFWNTVGSLEGWKPKSFKSSRTEKAEAQRCQLPKDFMDDEDLGEFGIAPQRVQAKDDFAKNDSSNRKRTMSRVNNPTDPLVPVLHEMLKPPREKVAVRLLMHMGWKPGQGVGARQTRKEKALANSRNSKELYLIKMYGCEMEDKKKAASINSEESEDSSEEDDDITFAPEDLEPFVCSSKDNTFGLGYSGLSGQISGKTSSHINLFGPLEVLGKNNKKLSIRGQAFGVGALEEEDDDIYAKDDMSQYDFCINEKKKLEKKRIKINQDQSVIEGFSANSQVNKRKPVFSVTLDASFEPKNWLQRKTRFEKLSESQMTKIMQYDAHKKKGIARHDIGPDERGKILCQTDKTVNEKTMHKEPIKKPNSVFECKEFVSSVKQTEVAFTKLETKSEKLPEKNQKLTCRPKELTNDMSRNMENSKPFAPNADKQERYEKFIAANLKSEDDIKHFLRTIQPLHLSEWDREMERKEFIQAKSIYKPLNGLMSERFVSKTFLSDSTDLRETKVDEPSGKTIINIQRTKTVWIPASLICKRFNIPETLSGVPIDSKPGKKGKFSIFDYIENSINSKKDFVTPVIVPKYVEKPLDVQAQNPADSNQKLNKENVVTIPKIQISTGENISNTVQTLIRRTKSPKTDLERKIEESKHKHPSEKKDIFKSIFDSSSDSDSDTNPDTEAGVKISNEIMDKLIEPSTSRNILKNNSPPRGIFASLFSSSALKVETQPTTVHDTEKQKLDKIMFKPAHQRNSTSLVESDDMYGPKLPQNVSVMNCEASKEKDIDRKIVELLSNKSPDVKFIEKWVEKKHSSKSKKKHKKKGLDSPEKNKQKKQKKKKKSHKKDRP